MEGFLYNQELCWLTGHGCKFPFSVGARGHASSSVRDVAKLRCHIGNSSVHPAGGQAAGPRTFGSSCEPVRACQGDDTMTISRHLIVTLSRNPYGTFANTTCSLANFFISLSPPLTTSDVESPGLWRANCLITWRAAIKIGGPRWRCSSWTIYLVFSPSLRRSWSEERCGPVLLFRASTASSSV